MKPSLFDARSRRQANDLVVIDLVMRDQLMRDQVVLDEIALDLFYSAIDRPSVESKEMKMDKKPRASL
jgi:hypothetical protein